MKLPLKSLLTALALSAPVFSQTVDDALDQFLLLAEAIDNVEYYVNNYNGGVVLALPVANSIYGAHTTASTARQRLAALDPLSSEDSQRAVDAYNEIHPRLVSALNAGRGKVQLFRNSGISYVAQGMLSNLYNEKNRFEDELRLKIDPAYFQEELAAALDQEFRDTLALF